MDLSALIFVALAVAWAVYLVPKALRQHEAGEASRSIESFSGRIRVLGRRPEADADAHVVRPGQPTGAAQVVRRSGPSPVARRRRVLSAVLLLLVVVGVLAATGVLAWGWISLPLVVLVAWLVACRLMVRREQSVRRAPGAPAFGPASSVVEPGEPPHARVESPAPALDTDEHTALDTEDLDDDHTDEIAVQQVPVEFDPETGAPVAWDPVPVTLPTYVGKEQAARRTVRTIDLDSTGVWTSGRSESDSALAREADESSRAARAARREQDAAELADRRRASGS